MPTYHDDFAARPGTVTAIRGIVFQNDGQSTIGRMFIRPVEALDRFIAGVLPERGDPPLAIHAGIRVVIDEHFDFVAEQLVGSLYMDFRNGLNWTPYENFRERDRGGWDATVPASTFRGIDTQQIEAAIRNLNRIQGHRFVGEDCTAFVERAFAGRRMFADSPLLRWFGIGVRVGDPALPLLKPGADLPPDVRRKLQFDKIRDLPDALADPESPNFQLWLHRLLPAVAVGALVGSVTRRPRANRRLLRAPRAGF